MKTTDKIIQSLKINGPQTAKSLANELSLTTMGVRQHMLQLETAGDIIFEDKKAERGRPTRYWSLSAKSNRYFPDGHEILTVQMIESVKSVFGEAGLEQLIEHRELATFALYQSAIKKEENIENQLKALAKLRSAEGYMASVVNEGDFYWLLENHCSICAAAKQCLSFCRSELKQFQALFAELATVSREEHMMQGARRCAYKVLPK